MAISEETLEAMTEMAKLGEIAVRHIRSLVELKTVANELEIEAHKAKCKAAEAEVERDAAMTRYLNVFGRAAEQHMADRDNENKKID